MRYAMMWVLLASLLVACGGWPGQRTNEDAPPATTTVAEATVAPWPVEPIVWQACDDPVVDEEGFACATVPVPLDYARPDGERINIAVIRYTASESRQGAILFNPGGPGGSGFDYVAQMGSYYVSKLGLAGFDFVGFDPRGVDRSHGIKCQSDADIDRYMYGDSSPDTPAEEAFWDESEAAFVSGCTTEYGDTLQYYSTANTARDMDVIRAAMGDEQINYLGVSYGTYLGAVYATMFPERVRAMVLDSAFQPNGDTVEEYYTTQLAGFEQAMNNWIAWCESTSECAFTATDVGARWDALYAKYDANPIAAPDGRMTFQGVIDTATTSALYSESQWPVLAEALAAAETGDVTGVWELADEYNDRDEAGVYKASVHAFPIIRCASGLVAPEIADAAALYATMTEISPRFTSDLSVDDLREEDTTCGDIMPDQAVAPVTYAGSAPILVIAGTNDPATPMRWATKLRTDMGPNAALLTYTGEGHGQVLQASCVDEAASAVLKDGTLPADGTVCDPDPAVARPAWWDLVPTAQTGEQELTRTQIRGYIGLDESSAFASGFRLTGDSASIRSAVEARLGVSGLWPAQDAESIVGGALLQDFATLDETAYVRVVIIGSDAIATDEWSSLRDVVDDGQGVVVFLVFAEWQK